MGDKIVLFKNAGAGTFGAAQILDNDLNSASEVYLIDIDSDGDLDVIGSGSGTIKLYRNLDGQGNFSNQQLVPYVNNANVYSIDFGDLDGDGDMDMSVAGNGLSIYLNLDGQGTFGPQQFILTYPYYCVSTKIADIDNDGDNDIVHMGENSGESQGLIAWLKNIDGAATFGEMQSITTLVANPTGMIVADFDNDGDIDVASSNSGEGGINWYRNTDGLGNFANTQQIVSQSSPNPFDLYASDIDSNGTMDIISITDSDDKIISHKNSGLVTFNSISGTVQFDLLGDGCTATDALLSGILVVAANNLTTDATFSQENGQFHLYTTEEGVISTQITAQLPTHYTASPAIYESTFSGLGNNDAVNFCIEPIAVINDLNVSFYPVDNDPRPGFDTAYRIVYKNTGTTQLSGTVLFEFDGSKLNYLNASEPIFSQTTNSLTFHFSNLNPFEIKTIDLEFNVFAPPVTNINDILITTATIDPVTGDYTQEDNVFTYSQLLVGSYDPNDITCIEGDQVLIEDADNDLHYLIRFQNTGTASAINVRVNHTLDGKLDWTTLQLESLSHTGQVSIHDGSEVNFVFDNINLPASTNDEPGSNGFIVFKIKPLGNVEAGDIIHAAADIYFDFNPAIVTNTAATEFVNVLSVNAFEAGEVSLYPNPSAGIINIDTTMEIGYVNIYNHLGQLVLSVNKSSKIDISTLTQGIYVLALSNVTGNTFIQKIIKK